MLDSNLIVNVVAGIAFYKIIIAVIENSCIKILEMLLNKKIVSITRQERRKKAIELASEELKKTELN